MPEDPVSTRTDGNPRRIWRRSALWGGLGFLLLYPLDGHLQPWLHLKNMGGDLRRSLETLQQFGDLSTLILTALFIGLLDPSRRKRLLDLFVAALAVAILCNLLKMGLGRPRPILADPWTLVLPWQTYLLPQMAGNAEQLVPTHAWQMGTRGIARLWSLPSSHTAAAVTLAVFLHHCYPRLKPLLIGLVVLVGAARVTLGAHYPSDVVAGAMLAYPVAWTIVMRSYASKLIFKSL